MTTKADVQREALKLPTQERVELAVEIWESVGTESVPVPDWHREVIRERLAALDELPADKRSATWEEAHERVFSNGA